MSKKWHGRYLILRIVHLLCLQCNASSYECWWSCYSRELSVTVFMACIDLLRKCSMIVTSPTVIKGCCVWLLVSALLMILPRTGGLLSFWLLPWDTQMSKDASVLMLPALPSHPWRVCGVWTTSDDLRLCWQRRTTTVIDGSYLATTNDVGCMTVAAVASVA